MAKVTKSIGKIETKTCCRYVYQNMQEKDQKYAVLASILLVTEGEKVNANSVVNFSKILVLILDDFFRRVISDLFFLNWLIDLNYTF